MEVTWNVFVLLAAVLLGAGGAVLIGFKSFSRSSKRSSESWEERLEPIQEEWKAFKRSMQAEWEDQYHKLRSVAGRIDRAKRTMKGEENPEGSPETAPENGAMGGPSADLAALNRAVLRSRGVPL